MQLLQGAILSLLLSSLRCSVPNPDIESTTSSSIMSTTINKPILAANTKSLSPGTVGTTKEATSREILKSPMLSTFSSLTTADKGTGLGVTTNGVTTNELATTNSTVTDNPLPNATSTLPGFEHMTENQTSIKTIGRPVNTLQPDSPSFQTGALPSTPMSENTLSSQVDIANGKNSSASSIIPSYSSIILPVVIALIVITLSVFVLVGLYRICRKTDPGTPENGNDQPQSDKESVKLLTVKTISHESGEHSAQGKTKN